MTNKGTSLINVSINLDGSVTEPLTKLIESISAGIGAKFEAGHLREMAKAKRDAALTEAQTAIGIRELNRRAEERVWKIEQRRQKNIESIVSMAANQLPATVNAEKVDEDWIVQFFNSSQDVGNEEMQKIWAKILAGEVARPGTFSFRTLNLLKLLQQSDAILFKVFCRYLWVVETEPMNIVCNGTANCLEAAGLGFPQILHLENLGLINRDLAFRTDSVSGKTAVLYQGRAYEITCPNLHCAVNTLTDVGKEIASLCDDDPDDKYCSLVLEEWRRSGYTVEPLKVADTSGAK